MSKQPTLAYLSALAARGEIPRGIIDEGRIFFLGQFTNSEKLSKRVVDVVDGLRTHIGQPFDIHPWAFFSKTLVVGQDGFRSTLDCIETVFPQKDGSIVVVSRKGMKNRILVQDKLRFHHTPNGTRIIPLQNQRPPEAPDLHPFCNYPLAIAILNTRGCSVDLKRPPKILNEKRVRQGKHPTPAHYNVDAAEYLTALSAEKVSRNQGGTHASPIPHLRRAHERILANGSRIWVSSSLINVRNQDDIAFVEKRKAYRSTH
ncbi:hypothetical protein Q4494_17860 [Celeribacter halophilus]|uniref:Uncharacterized protein n=1 Tax=Celeribacter halophilus TaxID=576117 RepID=A0AAW7XXB4_9RHOB|nr:hypothetical protein [Celeribacter halophilus]MDO6458946.1 hypothetical protein [Celeribacter halophilus]